MPLHLKESEIIERATLLPAFPTVVNDILETLDDENAAMGALVQLVERDPVITARVLSIANAAVMAGRTQRDLRDMQVAVSLIGLSKLREIVLAVSLAKFSRESGMASHFWEHSIAVGVAAQELSRIGHCSRDFALVCGLLHDIGQLWMARCHPLEFQMVRMSMEQAPDLDILDAEIWHFGLDHCTIGRLLGTAWHLPAPVIAAIQHHHDAHPPADKLIAVTHLGEAVVNALNIERHDHASVRHVSATACDVLGIDWRDDFNFLFGRIEARARNLARIFN